MPLQIADLIFMRLAHIENEQIVSAIEAGLEFARSNFRHLHGRTRSFFPAHTAELVIVDQLVDRAVRSAHRTIRILAELELAELHAESVKQKQAPHEIVPAAEDQLDRFHRLNGANDSGQNAEHSAFCAGRHKSWRRRFRIEAAIAWPIRHAKHGGLSFKPENRAIDVWLSEQDARVIHEVTGRKIVRAVYDDVEVLEEFERVGAGQLCFKRLNLNVRIEVRKARARRFALRLSDIGGAKRNLALEIGGVDDVEVNQPELADACGGKIQTERSAEPARANEQHLGVFQLELPIHADFRHDEMTAVAQNFFVGKARSRFCTGLRLYSGGHCCSLLLYDAIPLPERRRRWTE